MKRSSMNCPRCGHANELGRVFCSKCGVRLDLSRINARVLARGATKPHEGLFRMLRVLLLLFLAAVIGLMLWPAELVGEPGSVRDARRLENKIQGLIRAQDSGLYVFEIVSEREVNAYLADVLKNNESLSRSEGMRLGIEAIRVQFLPDAMTVVILANWGPARLSYEVRGVPVTGTGAFSVDVQSARWGHLLLPGASADWVSGRVAVVFSQMKRDWGMLDQLERCDLGQGKVRLVTKGRR